MLETARCRLTSLQASDRENYLQLQLDPDVRRFLGGPADQAQVQKDFEWLVASGEAAKCWAIRQRETDVLLGIVSLSPHHDGQDTEISYQLFPQWWRQGYAKEVMQTVLTHALQELGLPRVIAETQTANTASCALLSSLGLRWERSLKRFGTEQSIYVTA